MRVAAGLLTIAAAFWAPLLWPIVRLAP